MAMGWDWDAVRAEPPPHPESPHALELLEEHWRIVGPSGRVVICAVYCGDGPGFEVRAGYSVNEFLRTQRVGDLTHAYVVGQMWRAAVMAKGFKEVPKRARNHLAADAKDGC